MGISEGATGGAKPPTQRSLSEAFPALLMLDPEGSDRLLRAEGVLEASGPGVRPDRDEPFVLAERGSSTSEEVTTFSPRREESVLASPLPRDDRSVALALYSDCLARRP